MTFEFTLDMGKHAIYVWPAYGIALVVLLGNIIWPWIKRKQVLQNLKRQIRRNEVRGNNT